MAVAGAAGRWAAVFVEGSEAVVVAEGSWAAAVAGAEVDRWVGVEGRLAVKMGVGVSGRRAGALAAGELIGAWVRWAEAVGWTQVGADWWPEQTAGHVGSGICRPR